MEMLIHAQKIKGVLHDLQISEPKIHADNEKNGRSGHMGHALTEFAPGKIMAFSSNTSANRSAGHTGFGWMEYRISEDYGDSWGEPIVFPYSWEALLDGLYCVAVEKAVTCDNGDIAVFCYVFKQAYEQCCGAFSCPVVVISKDQGKTWEAPMAVSNYKGRIYDVLYYKGCIYALQHCHDGETHFCGNQPEHIYRLLKSEDKGCSFQEICVVPFDDIMGLGYGSMVITPDERLIVYAYNRYDEENMSCIVSKDFGKSWGKTQKSFVKNRIRNPQVGVLDGQYILHGRAGDNEKGDRGAFVFYTSKDGLIWDDGVILVKNRHACFYSDNLTVTMPSGKQRMIVKYSENYHIGRKNDTWGQVNSMMLTLETVK